LVLLEPPPYIHKYGHMKTTIELPDDLLRRAKVTAANQGTSLKQLFIRGLESVLEGEETSGLLQEDPVSRLRKGYHLGGKAMHRSEAHER
jgi:hypothetical protein